MSCCPVSEPCPFRNARPAFTNRLALAAILLGCLGSGLVGLRAAGAQVVDWVAPGTGYWDNGSSWSSGFQPAAGETARFNLNQTFQVNWDSITGNTTTAGLQVMAGEVNFLRYGNVAIQHTVTGATSISGSTTHFLLGSAGTSGMRLKTDQLQISSASLTVRDGSQLQSDFADVIALIGLRSTIEIRGSGSQWTSNGMRLNNCDVTTSSGGRIVVGQANLDALAGETVSVGRADAYSADLDLSGGAILENNGSASVGYQTVFNNQTATARGQVWVSGAGTQWNNSGNLVIGSLAEGILEIGNGGTVTNQAATIANLGGAGSVLVTGDGSRWSSAGSLLVGNRFGQASLQILDGGLVESNGAVIANGNAADFNRPEGVVTVSGAGSKWINNGSLTVAGVWTGSLNVLDGGTVISGNSIIALDYSTGAASVVGPDSLWQINGFLDIAGQGDGSLTVLDGGTVSSGIASLGLYSDANGSAIVSGAGSTWNVDGEVLAGLIGDGSLSILRAGTVSSEGGKLSAGGGGVGTAVVSGTGSGWFNSAELHVGYAGHGELKILDGGRVTSSVGSIGFLPESSGLAEVSGAGSEWVIDGDLLAGPSGLAYGEMNITAGGSVRAQNSVVTRGIVRVDGAGSHWHSGNNLVLGGGTQYATLDILDGGRVSVGNRSTIGTGGFVYLNGGRFEFGRTSLDSFQRVFRQSGSMAGSVEIAGIHSMNQLQPVFEGGDTDLSEVRLTNAGLLTGSGLLDTSLENLAGAQVRATANDWMRFGGSTSTNAGRITNLGGIVEFGGSMTNSSTGFMTGRGAWIAGHWTNLGAIAVSGTTDIIGALNNAAGGLIVTSAGATTTFYDPVINNGEIRTSGNANSVFFDTVSGAGGFTGTGNVFFEGDVNPGNSPAVVSFGGNLSLGSASHTLFELGGTGLGEYDRFEIAGNLALSGTMSVAMWDNFQLAPGMNFLIAQIGGNRSGFFAGFGEGARVGNFSGQDLFITYGAGNGNDIALFTLTAVPEPGAALLCLSAGCLACRFRRRRQPLRQ